MSAFDTFVGLPLNQSIASAGWDSGAVSWDAKTWLQGNGADQVKVGTGIPGVVLGNYTALAGHVGQRVFFTPLAGRDGAQYVIALALDSTDAANSATAGNCVRAQVGAYGLLFLDDLGGASAQTNANCALVDGNRYCLEHYKTTDPSGKQYRATVYNAPGDVITGAPIATQTITVSTARSGRLVQVASGARDYVTVSRIEAIDAAAPTPATFTGPAPTRNGVVGTAASFANASFFSGSATPFAYSLQAGTLPAGLTLSSSTGIISGTPTTAGTSAGIVVRATDANSATADTNAYSIVIAAANTAPTFTGTIANITGTGGTAITTANVSSAFSDTDTLTYSASPAGTAWPSGLVINSATGVISGTVATSTTTGLKVRATDTASQTVDSNAFSVTISAPASTVSGVTVAPTTATVAGGATQTFTATVAGTGSPSQTVNWTATAGTINSSGVLTAPASTASVQTITVTATSAQDGTKSNTATVTVPAVQAASGSFKTRPLGNNTTTPWAAGTAVNWTWEQGGRIGSAPTSVTRGTGAIASDYTLTMTGLPAGAGFALIAKRGATYDLDNVYYQPGTVA